MTPPRPPAATPRLGALLVAALLSAKALLAATEGSPIVYDNGLRSVEVGVHGQALAWAERPQAPPHGEHEALPKRLQKALLRSEALSAHTTARRPGRRTFPSGESATAAEFQTGAQGEDEDEVEGTPTSSKDSNKEKIAEQDQQINEQNQEIQSLSQKIEQANSNQLENVQKTTDLTSKSSQTSSDIAQLKDQEASSGKKVNDEKAEREADVAKLEKTVSEETNSTAVAVKEALVARTEAHEVSKEIQTLKDEMLVLSFVLVLVVCALCHQQRKSGRAEEENPDDPVGGERKSVWTDQEWEEENDPEESLEGNTAPGVPVAEEAAPKKTTAQAPGSKTPGSGAQDAKKVGSPSAASVAAGAGAGPAAARMMSPAGERSKQKQAAPAGSAPPAHQQPQQPASSASTAQAAQEPRVPAFNQKLALLIKVISGKEMPSVNTFGGCDPFVECRIQLTNPSEMKAADISGEVPSNDTFAKTKVLEKENSPKWNENLTPLKVQSTDDMHLQIILWDYNMLGGNTPLGHDSMSVTSVVNGLSYDPKAGKSDEREYTSNFKSLLTSGSRLSAKVKFKISYVEVLKWEVAVKSAERLPAVGAIGTIDPFVEVRIVKGDPRKKEFEHQPSELCMWDTKTEVQHSNQYPEWKHKAKAEVLGEPSLFLQVILWDSNALGDTVIGHEAYDLSEVVAGAPPVEHVITKLRTPKGTDPIQDLDKAKLTFTFGSKQIIGAK